MGKKEVAIPNTTASLGLPVQLRQLGVLLQQQHLLVEQVEYCILSIVHPRRHNPHMWRI